MKIILSILTTLLLTTTLFAGEIFITNNNRYTFTTIDGKTYSNINIYKVESVDTNRINGNGICWKNDDGWLGRIAYTNMTRKTMESIDVPDATIQDLCVLVSNVLNQIELEKERQRLENIRLISEKIQSDKESIRRQAMTIIKGRILQCISDGTYLISTDDRNVYVVDMPKGYVDDDYVNLETYFIGTYEYGTVMDSKATVRKYTADYGRYLQLKTN